MDATEQDAEIYIVLYPHMLSIQKGTCKTDNEPGMKRP